MSCQHQSFVEGCPDCRRSSGPSDSPLSGYERTLHRSDPDPPPPSAPARGTVVGRYVLLDRIGEGGMGFVYVAYDPELDRKVAIKLLRYQTSSEDSRTEGQARMLREAQAMARLSHPNVVSVYDVGVFQDSVFLAMEYVEGETLAHWARSPRTEREIIHVLTAAAGGLVAAHRAGIVHRDFKPANVLIGKDGRVRVTDFGLARAAEVAAVPEPPSATPILLTQPVDLNADSRGSPTLRTPITLAGSMMGTPGYMAPEQYLGQATTPQTDQFSFCVSLFEALYRTLPFQGSTLGELSAAVLSERVVPAPSGSRVPLRIRNILLRGLSRDPTRRFPSMETLLAELARDPSRNRRRGSLGAAVAVGLLGALLLGRYFLQRRVQLCRGAELKLAGVWDEGTRSKIRQQFVDTGAPFAPQAWTGVYRQLNEYARSWSQAFTDTCEATRVRGEQSEQVLDLRMGCLDGNLKELTALTQLFLKPDKKIVENAMAASEQLPSTLRCADVNALREPVPLPKEPKQIAQIESLQAQVVSARELQHAGKFKEAMKLEEETVKAADVLNYTPLQAEALFLLSETQNTLSDHLTELETLKRAFRAAEAGHQERLVAQSLIAIGDVVGSSMNHPEQGRVIAALAAGAIARIGHDDSLESKQQRSLGNIAWRQGSLEESLGYYREALRHHEKALGADNTGVASILGDLGWVLIDLGKLDEAQVPLERSYALREKMLGPDHPAVIASLNDLSRLSLAKGDYKEAIARLQKMALITDRVFGADSSRHCALLNNLSQVLASDDQTHEAVVIGRRAVDVCKNSKGLDSSSIATAQLGLGTALRLDGHPAEALEVHRASRALLESKFAATHPILCQQSIEDSFDLLALARNAEALRAAQNAEACDTRNKIEGSNYSDALTAEGRAYLQLGRVKDAVGPLQRALDIRVAGKVAPTDVGDAQFTLAKALWKQNRSKSASLIAQARETYTKAGRTREVRQVIAWKATHK